MENSFIISSHEFDQVMQNFLPMPSSSVIAAVSGGPDSLALALLLQRWAEAKSIHVIAVTVDHGLRPEAATEALWVHELMKAHKIEHHILKLIPPVKKTGVQSWARDARYEALELFGLRHHAQALFLGHHQDDQIETLLMRMLAGSHYRGLSGILPERMGQAVLYLRPLLGFSKEKLMATLTSFGVDEYVQDPTNEQDHQGRGLIRHSLIPGLNMDFNILIEMGESLQALRQVEDDWLSRFIEDVVFVDQLGYVRLNYEKFIQLDSHAQTLVLKKCIFIVGAPRYPLSDQKVIKAISQLPKSVTLGSCILKKKKDDLYIVRENRGFDQPVPVRGEGLCFFQKRFLIGYHLPDAEGYRFEALGKRVHVMGEKEWGGVFLPMKEVLYSLPCLTYLDELVAVPHLCYSKNGQEKIDVELLFTGQQQLLKRRTKGPARE